MKLNRSKAANIRAEFSKGEGSITELAKRYQVSRSTIRSVLNNDVFFEESYEPKSNGFNNVKLKSLRPEIEELRKRGFSYSNIGKYLAVKHNRRRWGKVFAWSGTTVRRTILSA